LRIENKLKNRSRDISGGIKMEGWTAEEIKNKNLRAPCGIFCGACPIYIATRDNNEKMTNIICAVWQTRPEDAKCFGCLQTDPPQKLFGFCQKCAIRSCAKAKDFYSCHQCDKWPCDIIESSHLSDIIPSSIKKSVSRVINRAIPLWRNQVAKLGDEAGSLEWAKAEAGRYHCPSCGKPLYRSAQQCRACKKPLAHELDGVI
jgi:hypothetical protein